MIKIPVEVSARHCHLKQAHINKLFGKGFKFRKIKNLSQPCQFAAREEIKIKGPKGELNLRIVAPARKYTQVELAITDCFRLGLKPVLRVSGHHQGTPGAVLIGPKGNVKINQGVIVAQRHLHLHTNEAKKMKLRARQIVKIKIGGPRSIIFDKVIVRTGPWHKMAFQIDTDEGNARGWRPGMKGELIR